MTYIVSYRYNGKVHCSSFTTLTAAQIYLASLGDDRSATITVKV